MRIGITNNTDELLMKLIAFISKFASYMYSSASFLDRRLRNIIWQLPNRYSRMKVITVMFDKQTVV